MAKLPVTQGATRRAYSRAAWQARRRWLATKLMGQQPRRAEHERGEPAGSSSAPASLRMEITAAQGKGSVHACLAQGWEGAVWWTSISHHNSTYPGQDLGSSDILPPAPPSGQEPIKWA